MERNRRNDQGAGESAGSGYYNPTEPELYGGENEFILIEFVGQTGITISDRNGLLASASRRLEAETVPETVRRLMEQALESY